MSTRLFTLFVIISLLVGCVFMLVRFRKLQQQKAEAEQRCVRLQNKAQDQLSTYQSNLETAISNRNLQLENQMVKDTLNNRIPLKSIFAKGQRQLLVCRFSQQHCESCVDATIQILQKQVNQIGVKNIVYLGNHRFLWGNDDIFLSFEMLFGTGRPCRGYQKQFVKLNISFFHHFEDFPSYQTGCPYYCNFHFSVLSY